MNLGIFTCGPPCGIYHGDAKELAKEIPDCSVDFILTDPVYSNIDDYLWLALLAARVLKDGGSVIAQAGSEYRYEAESAMRSINLLVPRPLIAEVYPGATAQMWKHKTFCGWKPHIWMTRGERAGNWIFDRFYGGGRNKKYHKWGDSGSMIAQLIQRLTDQDGIVLDPFTGGGIVPATCKMLNRHYLAFEVDNETAKIAQQHVENTQPPLFVQELEQQKLSI